MTVSMFLFVVIQTYQCIVCRFRPSSTKHRQFFVRYGSGKPVTNVSHELDSFQREFHLPSICSSNARHVVETLKGNAGLEATASAGIY